ncbi:MAG: DUF4296 domain-containing protein [Tannerella sp.]|jgi:hypothetical protein|nr:DUF4296 domain-containing protein [Tannerella sp.]
MLKYVINVFSGCGFLITIGFFVIACSRVPKGIIPEKRMQHILMDMHLAEAIIDTDPSLYQFDRDKKALFQSVFDKHRITEAIYDSSLVWYGKNLDIYMQLNTMALAEITQRIEAINLTEPEQVLTVNENMKDIWTIGKYHEFYFSSLSNALIFKFGTENNFSFGDIFVLGLKVIGFVSGMQSPIEVHLRAVQNDTTIMLNQKITTDGYHEMLLRTLPVRRINQFYGYIRFNGDSVPYHKIYLNDIRLMKYRYGSEEAGKLEDNSRD